MAGEQRGERREPRGYLSITQARKPQLTQNVAKQQRGIGFAREKFGRLDEEIGADPIDQPRVWMETTEQQRGPKIGIDGDDAVKTAEKGVGKAPTGTWADKNETARGWLPACKKSGQSLTKRLPKGMAADQSAAMPSQTAASVSSGPAH